MGGAGPKCTTERQIEVSTGHGTSVMPGHPCAVIRAAGRPVLSAYGRQRHRLSVAGFGCWGVQKHTEAVLKLWFPWYLRVDVLLSAWRDVSCSVGQCGGR